MRGRNDNPRNKHPIAILVTLPGSLPVRDCPPQKEIRIGVSAKINIGFTAWNQVEGISNPNTCQSALRSAKILQGIALLLVNRPEKRVD